MPRIRTIKPEFFTSPTIAELEYLSRLTFIGIWTYVDDEGRGRDDPRLVRAALYPLDDDVTTLMVEEALASLEAKKLIVRYEIPGQGRFFMVRSWAEHQSINRPSPSKYPPPDEATLNAHGIVIDDSLGERKGKEQGTGKGTGKGKPSAKGEPLGENWEPDPKVLADLATKYPDIDQDLQLENFRAYWLEEGKPKKDWNLTLRRWFANAEGYRRERNGSTPQVDDLPLVKDLK